MATKVRTPIIPSETPVEVMPPLDVTTQGIPTAEHVETPPPVRERRARTLAWALAGVVGALLMVALGVVLYAVSNPAPDVAHMGLTTEAWQEYRAGERASTTPFLNGITLPAWQQYRGGEAASATVSAPYAAPAEGWAAYRAGERTAVYPAGHMGIAGPVWREYRAGERAATSPLHMGLTIPAWQEYRAGEQTA